MAKIHVSYDKNLNMGNYTTARIGLVIDSDKECHGEEEIAQLTEVLLGIAKKVVQNELEKLKTENGEQ